MQLACFGLELRLDPHIVLLDHQTHRHLAAPLHSSSAATPATTTWSSSSPAPDNPSIWGCIQRQRNSASDSISNLGTSSHHPSSPWSLKWTTSTSDLLQDFYLFQQHSRTLDHGDTVDGLNRDPEQFFFTMTGDWEWSQRTADYWRHFFGVPMRHGTSNYSNTAADHCCSRDRATGPIVLTFGIWGTTGPLDRWATNNFDWSSPDPVDVTKYVTRGYRLISISPWLGSLLYHSSQLSPLPENKPCYGRVCVCDTSVQM